MAAPTCSLLVIGPPLPRLLQRGRDVVGRADRGLEKDAARRTPPSGTGGPRPEEEAAPCRREAAVVIRRGPL